MDTSVVVDASVWVSWLIASDIHHDESIDWIIKYLAEGGLLVAPAIMLIEVAAAISRQTGEILQAQDMVKNLDEASEILIVPLDKALIWNAVQVATHSKLRAGDAAYVALAYQLNIPLISWDKEQLTKAHSLIATYTPDAFPFDGGTQL